MTDLQQALRSILLFDGYFVKKLLNENLWPQLALLSNGHRNIRAAISYVTAKHLNFKNGDLLICDASETAIKGGLTSAAVLRAFFEQGAKIYSFAGLHSKVAVIDRNALIGSANLSENAGIGTCEASLFTDDPQIRGLIQGFVESVKAQSVPITDAYLRRIEAIPVVRSVRGKGKRPKIIKTGNSRVWLVGSRELSEKLARLEAPLEEKGVKLAAKKLQNDSCMVKTLRWSGSSRFRTEAKPGDLVVEVFTEKRGTRKFVSVFPPAPVLCRQEGKNWTRFYLESDIDAQLPKWRDLKKEIRRVGLRAVKPNSTQELIGATLEILGLFQGQT